VQRVVLPFTESWLNATGAPGFYDWIIRGQSVFDPDYALSADSCAGVDLWQSMYLRYKTHASAISITVTNLDATDPVNVSVFPSINPVSTNAAHQDAILYYPRSKHMTVGCNGVVKTLVHAARTAEILNVKDLDSGEFTAAFDANPATQFYWHVVTWNNAGSASNCEMLVNVKYSAELSGPAYFVQ
jgi:predicted secreted protein